MFYFDERRNEIEDPKLKNPFDEIDNSYELYS